MFENLRSVGRFEELDASLQSLHFICFIIYLLQYVIHIYYNCNIGD